MRRLHRLYRDYPLDAVRQAVRTALDHGLSDLGRLERMILRRLSRTLFRLPGEDEDDG